MVMETNFKLCVMFSFIVVYFEFVINTRKIVCLFLNFFQSRKSNLFVPIWKRFFLKIWN